ncbi:MAG: hypothetical protein GY703_19315 [Gammaproteobacteria bacterium]|nr:hypothetical protein [Gammaproteobacteria bacterium]
MTWSTVALTLPVVLARALSFSIQAQNAVSNCNTVEQDIVHLEHEKKSTDDRAVKGVVSITPIGLAKNTADSVAKSGQHKEMDVNEYNERLSQRIAEIKQACGIK